MSMKINLFGSTGKDKDNSISAEELINTIPTKPKDKSSGGPLIRTFPGDKVDFIGAAPDPLLWISDDHEIIDIYCINSQATNPNTTVFENRLYAIVRKYNTSTFQWDYYLHVKSPSIDNTVISLGSSSTSIDFTNMAHSISSDSGYLVFGNRASNILWVVDMGYTAATDNPFSYTLPYYWWIQTIDYQDGYFIANIFDLIDSSQNKIVSSDFGTYTFTSTNFGLINSSYGNLLRVESDKREIWAYCDDHIELWYNAGSSGFPFLRNPSIYIDIGLYSRDSVARFNNIAFFVGISNIGEIGIYRIDGYSVRNITPDDLRNEFKSNANENYIRHSIGRGIGLTIGSFYIINFFEDTLGTWIYSLDTGTWSKLKSDGLNFYQYIKGYAFWQKKESSFYKNYHCIIPYKSISSGYNGIRNHGVVFYMDLDAIETMDPTGLPYPNTITYITRTLISRHIYGQDNKNLRHKKLTLEFVPSSTSITLYYSDDDGGTWTTWETFTLTASNGIYETYQLGMSRDRLYKLECSSNAEFTLINAWIDVDQMRH